MRNHDVWHDHGSPTLLCEEGQAVKVLAEDTEYFEQIPLIAKAVTYGLCDATNAFDTRVGRSCPSWDFALLSTQLVCVSHHDRWNLNVPARRRIWVLGSQEEPSRVPGVAVKLFDRFRSTPRRPRKNDSPEVDREIDFRREILDTATFTRPRRGSDARASNGCSCMRLAYIVATVLSCSFRRRR